MDLVLFGSFHKKNSITLVLCNLLIVFIISYFPAHAQQKVSQEDLLDDFDTYVSAPREVAYLHLNKSTYVHGEMLGFKAYIFDKFTKELSDETQNLYCVIHRKSGQLVNKQLIRVNKGTAKGSITIDSTFTAGSYVIKAYTNWMRNFNESNYYQQSFEVIANATFNQKPLTSISTEVDLQVLAEGGQMLYGVPNTVGIIAKNNMGLGIPYAYVHILDENNTLLTEVRLNELGMGRTSFQPKVGTTYKAKLIGIELETTVTIEGIKNSGLIMKTTLKGGDQLIEVLTNDRSLPLWQNKPLYVMHHNGEELSITQFQLNSNGKSLIKIPKETLYPGVNIFTIVNAEASPILERITFSKFNLPQNDIQITQVSSDEDSIKIKMQVPEYFKYKSSDLSISVLPAATKSYRHHQNIISKLYVDPYIRGYVQNSHSYFNANDTETNNKLDLLMLTQGWSSYNWNSIQNFTDNYPYPFERGIDIVATINNANRGTYITFPMQTSASQIFDVPDSENSFTIKGSTPITGDLLRVAYISNSRKSKDAKPTLNLQFFPSKIPELTTSVKELVNIEATSDVNYNIPYIKPSWESIEQLDEVVIQAKNPNNKEEVFRVRGATSKKIRVIKDRDRLSSKRIDLILQELGWQTQYDYNTGTMSVINPRVIWGSDKQNNIPLIYLNDALINPFKAATEGEVGEETLDMNVFSFITTENLDYIEYDFNGTGAGLMGGQAGYIKIYTKNITSNRGAVSTISNYKIPLWFEGDRRFFTPKYANTSSEFYTNFGTIDWINSLELNDSGMATIKLVNSGINNLMLFVEGVLGNNTLVSKRIPISTQQSD